MKKWKKWNGITNCGKCRRMLFFGLKKQRLKIFEHQEIKQIPDLLAKLVEITNRTVGFLLVDCRYMEL